MGLWNAWAMQRGRSLRDGVLQDRISGEVGWQQKSYPLGGDGTHALVWVYSKDGGGDREGRIIIRPYVSRILHGLKPILRDYLNAVEEAVRAEEEALVADGG